MCDEASIPSLCLSVVQGECHVTKAPAGRRSEGNSFTNLVALDKTFTLHGPRCLRPLRAGKVLAYLMF